MYVCICNALKERAVKDAAAGGVRTVTDVFHRCGARPQCGRCLHDIAQIIEEAREREPNECAPAAE